MIPTINVAVLKGSPSETNRQKSIKAVLQFRKLQAEIERVCKEKGIPVPELVC